MDTNNFQQFLQQYLQGGGQADFHQEKEEEFAIIAENVFIYEDDIEKNYNKWLSNIHKKSTENSQNISDLILLDSLKSKKFNTVLTEAFANVSSAGGICGKVQTSADSGWKCLDCELDPTCIICTECFEKSNHKGHRIFFKKSVAGMCDCGDPEAWRLEGNCSDHSGFSDQELKLPQEFKTNFINGFRRCMYYLFYYLERPINNNTYNRHVSSCILSVFENLRKLFALYPKLSLLIAECMIIPANFALGTEHENKFKMWHDCSKLQDHHEDYLEYKDKKVTPSNFPSHPVCTCNLLEIFFRNSWRFQKKAKTMSEIFQCFYANYEFKKQYSIYYLKYAYFLAKDDQISKLWSQSIQILTSEDLAYDAITSPYFENFLDSVDEHITNILTNNPLNSWSKIGQLIQTIRYLLMKKRSIKFLFNESNLVTKFQLVFSTLNDKKTLIYYAKDKNEISTLEQKLIDNITFEERLIDFVMELCVMINQFSHKERELSYTSFIRGIVKVILEEDKNNEDSAKIIKEKISITELYHRMFCIIAMNYICLYKKDGALTIKEPCKANILKQNELIFDKNEFNDQQTLELNIECFWKLLLIRATEHIGFSREIERRQWSFLGPSSDFIKKYYVKCNLFDIDLILAQYSAFSLKSHDFWHIIVNNFSHMQVYKVLKDLTYDPNSKNNKYKHMQNMLEHDEPKYQNLMKLMGDHIELISQICNNELSTCFLLYNGILAGQDNATKEYVPEGGSFYDSCVRTFQLNYMLQTEPISHKVLKKKGESLVSGNFEIDDILSEITTFDNKTKMLRLKPALKNKMAGKLETRLFWKKQKILNSMQDIDKKLLRNEGKLLYVSESTIKMNRELREHQFNETGIEGLFRVVLQKGLVPQADHFMQNFYGLIITLGEIELNRPRIAKVILKVKESIFNEYIKDVNFVHQETLKEINNCLSIQLEGWPIDELNLEVQNNFKISLSKNSKEEKKAAIAKDNAKAEVLKRKKNKAMKKILEKKQKWIQAAKEVTTNEKPEGEDNLCKIVCQQCLEEIKFNDDYFFFGEQHYCNIRESTKQSIFSDLLYKQNTIKGNFDSMVILREEFKYLSEKSCDIFIKSCGHVTHTNCLDSKSDYEFAGGMASLYDVNYEFPCNLCKSAISLPIPYFSKDDILYKFECNIQDEVDNRKLLILDEQSENELIKLMYKLDKRDILKQENYVKKDLDERDQIELQFTKQSEKVLNEFITRFLTTISDNKETSKRVLKENSKVSYKKKDFIVNALSCIKSQVLFVDIIGFNSAYKFVKQYYLVLNCIRKYILNEIYNVIDGNTKIAEEFISKKISYAVNKFIDAVVRSGFDTFYNSKNLKQVKEIPVKNAFIYTDLDQLYAEIVYILPQLKVGKKQFIQTCKEFSNFFFGLKILQFYMRNEITDWETLSQLTLEDVKDEKLIDCLLVLLKKMVIMTLIVKYSIIERRSDIKIIEKLENLLKVNILDKTEELKLYIDFLEIDLNMKAIFYNMKMFLSSINVMEFDHKIWLRQFNNDWDNTSTESEEVDNKMDEENLITEKEKPETPENALANIENEIPEKNLSLIGSENFIEGNNEESSGITRNIIEKINETDTKIAEEKIEIPGEVQLDVKNKNQKVKSDMIEEEIIVDKCMELISPPLSVDGADLEENQMVEEKNLPLKKKDSEEIKVVTLPVIEKKIVEHKWPDFAIGNDIANIDYQLFKHDKQMSLTFIDLDPVFFDFYQNNLYRKCEICNEYPKKTDLVLCLLCNFICCYGECHVGISQSKNGNVARHAYECHGGACVYVNIMSGLALITEYGRYTYAGNIYQDKFGNGLPDLATKGFGEKEVDLRTLGVNYDCLVTLQKRLLEFALRYDIINTSLSRNEIFRRWNL